MPTRPDRAPCHLGQYCTGAIIWLDPNSAESIDLTLSILSPYFVFGVLTPSFASRTSDSSLDLNYLTLSLKSSLNLDLPQLQYLTPDLQQTAEGSDLSVFSHSI